MKYVIIGGVAGGATAAARLRRVDEQAEIILLEKGKYISSVALLPSVRNCWFRLPHLSANVSALMYG